MVFLHRLPAIAAIATLSSAVYGALPSPGAVADQMPTQSATTTPVFNSEISPDQNPAIWLSQVDAITDLTQPFVLNRAKNYARQRAEQDNGGLSVYFAEASMHGPSTESPYVVNDNGSLTFTFRGGPPGASYFTVETQVTVDYSEQSGWEIVTNYNRSITRTSVSYQEILLEGVSVSGGVGRQSTVIEGSSETTIESTTESAIESGSTATSGSSHRGGDVVLLENGYRVTFLGVSYESSSSIWRYYVEELPQAQDLSNWVLGLPSCATVVDATPRGERVNPDPNANISGIKWQPGGGFVEGEFAVTLSGSLTVGEIAVAVKGPDVARGQIAGPACGG